MWEFLSDVLERGGVVAALFFMLTIGFGLVVRTLWNQNQKLHKQLKTQADSQKKMAQEHAQVLSEQADKHAQEKRLQSEEYTAQLLTLTSARDDLQERRVVEKGDVVEKMMNYISSVDRFVNKLETVVDILVQAGRG